MTELSDKVKLQLLKDFLEVVPQYKYTSQNTLQVRIKQDLIYNDQTALIIKSILEDKDLEELKKEFPMIQF